jgi:hypothetical protein
MALSSRGGGDVSRVTAFLPGASPARATLGAAIVAYYSFVGFETSANVAEEMRDPSRVYLRALFSALVTAGVVWSAGPAPSPYRRPNCRRRRARCCLSSEPRASASPPRCSASSLAVGLILQPTGRPPRRGVGEGLISSRRLS